MAALMPYGVRVLLARTRTGIEQGVRRAVHGGTPSWRRRPNVLPWLDRDDAEASLARDGHAPEDAALLRRWLRDGYVVLDDVVDPRDVDDMVATLDGLWDAPAAIPSLELLDLRDEPKAAPRTLSHADLLALPPDQRRRMREASDWRIHGFHYVNAAAKRLFWNARLRRVASLIFGRRARPIAAINFMKGSRQALHQDMAVFHIYPHNHLLGAWIACEDIRTDSGPLVFHPGSHRSGLFPGFTDYPQTNLRTADPTLFAAYQAWIDEQATRYERREFLARKGQVLLWHGMMFHGGAPVLLPATTRKSMVLHYTVRGADRAREVRGPFNW